MDMQLSRKFANMSLLCAILVVSIHIGRGTEIGSGAWYFSQVVSSGIAGIAIPFFFFASGFFVAVHSDEPGWYGVALRKRCRTLLIPYLLWNIIYFCFENGIAVAANAIHGRGLMADVCAGGGVYNVFGLDLSAAPYLFVLWYVRALLVLVAVSPILIWLLNKTKGFILVLLWVLYAIVVPGDEAAETLIQSMLKWSFSLLGMFYFSLGIWFEKMNARNSLGNDFLCGTKKLAVISLAGGSLALAIQIWSRWKGVVLPVSPRPVMVFLLMISVFAFMPGFKLPQLLAGAAFPIYILHVFVRVIPFRFIDNDTFGMLLLTWAITVALCMVVGVGLRKIVPKTASLLFGGR